MRKRPFSFVDGFASLFDDAPFTRNYFISKTTEEADVRAMRADFIVTGDDMRAALRTYARTI